MPHPIFSILVLMLPVGKPSTILSLANSHHHKKPAVEAQKKEAVVDSVYNGEMWRALGSSTNYDMPAHGGKVKASCFRIKSIPGSRQLTVGFLLLSLVPILLASWEVMAISASFDSE